MASEDVPAVVAKWVYFTLFTVGAVVSWLLRDFAKTWFKEAPGGVFDSCLSKPDTCTGKEAVLRMSLGLFLFFGLHALIMVRCRSRDDPRTAINSYFWWIKIPVLIGLLVMSFYLPSAVIGVYGGIARFIAALFLLLQLLVLVDFVYQLNEFLIDDPRTWKVTLLISLTAICYVLGLVAVGVSYHYYALHASCGLNIFFITWTLVLGIVITAVSVSPCRVQQAGLFTAAAIFLYLAYLLVSSLSSQPVTEDTDQCIRQQGYTGKWILIVGFVIALGSVLLSVISLGHSGETFDMRIGHEQDQIAYRPDFLHAILMLGSAYFAMLFTSWSLNETTQQFVVDRGWISTWVKIVSQWVCALLYLWTLIAHRVLKDRYFE